MVEQRRGSDDDAPAAVFVYGTLRPGRSNWRVAAPLCVGAEPATLPGFALFALDHPGAVELGPDHLASGAAAGVRGEILWLDADRIATSLARLDSFEGYDRSAPDRSYYRRVLRPVITDDGRVVDVWVYVPGRQLLAQVADDRRVPGDDWPC